MAKGGNKSVQTHLVPLVHNVFHISRSENMENTSALVSGKALMSI